MYQMKENLNKIIEQDSRIANYVIFIEDEKSDEYSLTILPKEFQSSKGLLLSQKGTPIEGYKNYLINWEEAPTKSVILYTDNAKAFKKNVSLSNVKILTGPYDIINYFKLLPYKIEESLGSEWLGNELLEKIKSEGISSKNLSLLFFGIPDIVPSQLLAKWSISSDFEKWLSWLWFKFEIKDGYLAEVIKKSNNYQDLIPEIYCGIFDYTIDDYDTYFKNYSERKELVVSIGLEAPPAIFWDRLDKIAIEKKVFYLTDCTQKEREKIISLIGQAVFNDRLNIFLKNAYPVLSAYLNPYVFKKEVFTDYFIKYKKNKIANYFPEEFIKEVGDIAEKKGIWWELEPRKKLIDDAYDEESHIFWVDALGVEFLSLIEHILNNRYRDIDYYVDIGYANLPTITETNKSFTEGREYTCFRELDKLKHQGDYPQCIEKELELIEISITQAIQKLEKYRKVIVVSDHGSSRGAILSKGSSKKAMESAKIERFGRYCIDEKNSYEKLYKGCIDKGEYHIFANYDRFAIGGNEKSEIHGGATLEEVLIPVIVLSRTPFGAKAVITVIDSAIKLRPGILPKIKFKIDKALDEVHAVVDATKYNCIKEGDYWYFEFQVGKKEEYLATIYSKGKIGEFVFKVIKGRSDSKEFDI